MPIIKNKVVSLLALLIVLKALLLKEYLQKVFINSFLPLAVFLLLLLVYSLFLPPVYIQEDFDEVFCSINNPGIDTAGAITNNITSSNTTSGDVIVTNPTNLDLDSIDFFQDFTPEDIETVIEVLDTEEGKDTNIFKSLPKLANFCNLSA